MATHYIHPEPLDVQKPEQWPMWIRRFERFRSLTGLDKKNQPVQVDTLLYTLGESAEDILASFSLSDEDSKKYDTVVAKFQSHFVVRHNVIYERAKFNMRIQEGDESVDSFITDLHKLAEKCDYGVLREEMIRDRIVVGIKDRSLSEKLQLNADLTYTDAMSKSRQSEAVKKQQSIVRNTEKHTTESVEFMRKGNKKYDKYQKQPFQKQSQRECHRCGKLPFHILGITVQQKMQHASNVTRKGTSALDVKVNNLVKHMVLKQLNTHMIMMMMTQTF
jgi:hypothetical protein